MLAIARRKDEVIKIGDDITIKVIRIRSGVVRLGIVAPPEVPVHRLEIYERIRAGGVDVREPPMDPAA